MFNRREFILSAAVATTAATLNAKAAVAGGHGRVGRFSGRSDHVTSGRAEVVKHGDTAEVVLLDDFAFDGAPDPKVALGKDGYDSSTILGVLKNNNGKQTYKVPAGINTDEMNEVWIWCEKFNVPLGVAKLN
ncbi:DM13 domain-containing protein [Roseovarius sp. CAU 1744]|uniref:DM13 domain-containing protein n=1 Tax=Roseovarius sp. CAU 1744 TaxID=3140368 RepID=UPI00325AFE67